MNFKERIIDRAVEEAQHILRTKETVRETAKKFGVSKSTTHRDITFVLPQFNFQLGEEVREILNYNCSVRHIRGGIATKKRWDNINQFVESMDEFNKSI